MVQQRHRGVRYLWRVIRRTTTSRPLRPSEGLLKQTAWCSAASGDRRPRRTGGCDSQDWLSPDSPLPVVASGRWTWWKNHRLGGISADGHSVPGKERPGSHWWSGSICRTSTQSWKLVLNVPVSPRSRCFMRLRHVNHTSPTPCAYRNCRWRSTHVRRSLRDLLLALSPTARDRLRRGWLPSDD